MIKVGRYDYKSQMDILSYEAWTTDKVRMGVWGEKVI